MSRIVRRPAHLFNQSNKRIGIGPASTTSRDTFEESLRRLLRQNTGDAEILNQYRRKMMPILQIFRMFRGHISLPDQSHSL